MNVIYVIFDMIIRYMLSSIFSSVVPLLRNWFLGFRMAYGNWSEDFRGSYNKWDAISRSTIQVRFPQTKI